MAKKLWGGRFNKKTDPVVEEFTKSIQYDYKLAEYDLLGSMAHVEILKKSGYLTSKEALQLTKELNYIYENIRKGLFKPDLKSEDIHTNIQNILQKTAGKLALKLQTARSRNEQVAFATKLYCNERIDRLGSRIARLTKVISELAINNKNIIIPGFTHMQHAQPVYLKDYLYVYINMLFRDERRLLFISENINLTMGAGALAGTPIACVYYSKMSEYEMSVRTSGEFGESARSANKAKITPTTNSMDSVSDRDFVIEIISALSMIGMHLSRLAEDLIIWSTKEFDFIEIDDAYCTGSSLMPHKKNPDVLELMRGYAGRLYGNLVSVLTMMKGLPLTYNRDMQLDKEPLFDSFEIVSKELKALTGLIETLKFNKEKIAEHLKDESLYATDLVYYLVDKGIPFKEAHVIIGKLVRYSIDNGIKIKDMEDRLKDFSDKFVKEEIVQLFDPKVSVESKKSIQRRK